MWDLDHLDVLAVHKPRKPHRISEYRRKYSQLVWTDSEKIRFCEVYVKQKSEWMTRAKRLLEM